MNKHMKIGIAIFILGITSLAFVSIGSINQYDQNDYQSASDGEVLISVSPHDTFELPVINFAVNTNCRSGPGIKYQYLAPALIEYTYEIIGKSDRPDQYLIIYEPITGQECWVWTQYGTIFGDITSLPTIETPPIPLASIRGFVWADFCNDLVGLAENCYLLSYVGQPEGNGVIDYNEAPLANVEIDLYEGTCEKRVHLATAKTNANGTFIFNSLEAGTYCVALEAAQHGNEATLTSGDFGGHFTFPRRYQDFQFYEFTMKPGISYYGFDFGWDDWDQ